MTNIYSEWDLLAKELKNADDYIYVMNTIPRNLVDKMKTLCNMLLVFDDENDIYNRISKLYEIHIPIPAVIDTLFTLLQRHKSKKIQIGAICTITYCNIHQNCTYKKTEYETGVSLILEAFDNIQNTNEPAFYVCCMQSLRMFAVDYDIYSDNSEKITEIYLKCKDIKSNNIDVEHLYKQLQFRSLYNPMKVFNVIMKNIAPTNDIELQHKPEWTKMTKFDFIGKVPNILMYLLIEEVHQQDKYIELLQTNKTTYIPIKDTYPHKLTNKDGRFMINGVFDKLFYEFAPPNVIQKMNKNRQLAKDKNTNNDEYDKIPFEYAKTEYFIHLGLGFPIFMYHLIMKFYKNMDIIEKSKVHS